MFTNTNVHISMYKNDGTTASSSPSIGATVTSMKITGSNNVNYSIPMKNNPNSCLYDMMTIAVHSCKVNNNAEPIAYAGVATYNVAGSATVGMTYQGQAYVRDLSISVSISIA